MRYTPKARGTSCTIGNEQGTRSRRAARAVWRKSGMLARRRGLDTRIFWVYSPDIGVEGKRPKESPQRGTRIGESVLRMSSEPTVPEPVGGNARPFDRVMGQ